MRSLVAAVSLAALLAACGDNAPPSADAAGTPAPPDRSGQGGTSDWRRIVSPGDAANLGRLDQAWRLGRAEAEEKGFAEQVEALGPLVDPNAGQAGRVQPAPGTYRCRTINLGSAGEGGLAFVAYPFFRCDITLTPGGDLILTRTDGSQRTRGLLYPDTDRRLIFVGAEAWGAEETGWPEYGDRPVRDQVGVFERIGSERWRLVLPWPKVDSKLEILELVP